MKDPKPGRMADTKDFREKCAKVGVRIRALRTAINPRRSIFAREVLKMADDNLRKIEAGLAVAQFVKLGELARALKSTPNAILDFKDGSNEREAFKGLLEAAFVAHGLPLEQARPLSEAVLAVLDSPELRSTGISLEDSARTIGQFVIRQFLNSRQS